MDTIHLKAKKQDRYGFYLTRGRSWIYTRRQGIDDTTLIWSILSVFSVIRPRTDMCQLHENSLIILKWPNIIEDRYGYL